MESWGKKRKGPEILPALVHKSSTTVSIIWSHLSLEDLVRQKKKCKEDAVIEAVGSVKGTVTGAITAPPCVCSSLDPPGRGLKRKIGCLDMETQMGRKKKIEQDYIMGGIIGKGKFGSVLLCRSKVGGEEFACKTLRKGEEIVHREVEIMQHLSGHPGIVTLKAVYEDLEYFHLVMELCNGGRLLDQMAHEGCYSEHCAANLLKELVSVISYCHNMGVVHRDIKPENILLTSTGRVKLADFGLAMRVTNGQRLSGVVGSPAYVAPEVLDGEYSEKVDIWSAGVLLHALLIGVLPFHGDSLEAVFDAIKQVNLDFEGEVWLSISQLARDLVANMLTRDVSARLTADEVLRHPWILFHTEPTLQMLTFKPKIRNPVGLTSRRVTDIPQVERDREFAAVCSFLSGDSSLILSPNCSINNSEEQDEIVDALTVAVSCVRISEPKRSRLCSPASPIRQECSSNMKLNNLCTAF